MKTGKEIMLNYCQSVHTHDLDHLESCREVKEGLEKESYSLLDSHCPSVYGLGALYLEQCFIEDIPSTWVTNREQDEQCKKCWRLAMDTLFTD